MAIGRPTAALKTSGKDDMETSGFQGTFRAVIRLWGGYDIRLLFAFRLFYCQARVVKHIKINCRT